MLNEQKEKKKKKARFCPFKKCTHPPFCPNFFFFFFFEKCLAVNQKNKKDNDKLV
jgi:hypothetical protein